MKKLYKPFKVKRVTVEVMTTCAQKCTIYQGCDCSTPCGGSVINGAAIAAAPNVNGHGIIDQVLLATGSVYG